MNTNLWLCPRCGDYLQSWNLKYGMLTCDGCGHVYTIGEEECVVHDQYGPPPIPDPESNDE